MAVISRYFWNILISIDQFINTIFGGDPDETISSRLGKWTIDGENRHGVRRIIYCIVNWVVECFQKNHFKRAIEEDEGSSKIIE